jgi:uroporphyrinogen III methyltransferase/synthase
MGKVWLVGAGPGDPDLLTLRAARLIMQAGLIVHDGLVDPAILAMAKPGARLISVAKRRSRHTMPQAEINALLAREALAGREVVRLKGGDPFIFGRGGEEAETLAEAGIEWEVVPGVTSGSAVPAYAGIPVTHRGLSSSVAFVTGHEDPAKTQSSIRWEHLAQGVDTIVFFMGVSNLREIAAKLMQHGRAADELVAVARWGTYDRQQVWTSTLGEAAAAAEREKISSPAIIVVGSVVGLRERLSWFEGEGENAEFAEVKTRKARNKAFNFSARSTS